ncbi:hypothetical protein ID866_10545, partial [Astraeus odoratus]
MLVWAKEIQTMQSHRKNIQPSTIEGHAHLAQSVVRYLGLSSPAELEEYGIMSTADLVDFVSRLCNNHATRSDYFKAKQLTTNIIPILLSAGLTLSTHPLLALLKLHQTLLLSSFSPQATQEYLDEVIRISGKYFAGLSVVLEEGHPLRGVALTELGKLLAVDEPSPQTAPLKDESFPPSGPARLKAAYETHLRARKELLIGFGRDTEGGEIGQDVRETLVSLEQELGVWKTGIRNVMEDMRTTTEAIRA